MKRQLIIFLSLIFIILLFQVFRGLIEKETKKPTPPVKPKLLAFYENGWGGIYSGSLARLKEVKEKVNVISPVWLGLKADGEVDWDKTNNEAIDFFLQNGHDFIVLVTSGSGQNGSSILSSDKHRRNVLNSIAAYVKRVNAEGVCLDFEYLNPSLKEELTQFIRELKIVLAGKKLLVAVFPYVNWAEPTKEVYDYRRLGEICDGIIVMTYDQHRPKDAPGPVAAQDWVEANLKYFLTQMDAGKLWLGIAGYGYRWQTGKEQATALPAWYCRKKAIEKGIVDTYHPERAMKFYNTPTTAIPIPFGGKAPEA